MGNSQLSN
jgi:hypothetical protein